VTIPNGTSNGSHTVYAIGTSGDVASAPITVAVPMARTLTTSAWTVSDVSSGTAKDTSDPYVASGGPADLQSGFQPGFDTSRYLALDFNGTLPSGNSTSGANFNFSYRGTTTTSAAASTCFYFDVRRISTGNVLATHGSAANPVACNAALAFDSVSTALPEVTGTDIANDLEVRVYLSNASSGYNYQDRATVTGTEGLGSDAFTLYRTAVTNNASGPTTSPWSLNASGDGSVYMIDAGWDLVFNPLKYLKLTFPAYVPTSATGISATFKHSYKADFSGTTSCWYFEVYNGSTLLATHGSSLSPVSCNSTTSFVTDTISLPEVNSAAKANNLAIRIYMKSDNIQNATKRKTQHDLATVKIDSTS
jgi:hypothetical protein